MKIKLVALPCLCVDVFDGTNEMRPGGEALNFAAHASGFDEMEVTLLGAVGRDAYADCIMDSIADKRINTDYIRVESGMTTANNRTYLTAEGDRYYKENSWNGDIVDKMILNEAELNVIAHADAVFIHFWAGCFHQVLDAKKKYHFEDFSGKYDGLFNMSLAERGSVTCFRGERYRVLASKVEHVIDTTGCGDSYHAGFVCEHLIHGDIAEAMKKGSELAAETLGHYGGF